MSDFTGQHREAVLDARWRDTGNRRGLRVFYQTFRLHGVLVWSINHLAHERPSWHKGAYL